MRQAWLSHFDASVVAPGSETDPPREGNLLLTQRWNLVLGGD